MVQLPSVYETEFHKIYAEFGSNRAIGASCFRQQYELENVYNTVLKHGIAFYNNNMKQINSTDEIRGSNQKAILITISCAGCDNRILSYQNSVSRKLHQIGNTLRQIEYESKLVCSKCKVVVGTPIRKLNGELSFRLRQGYFTKRRIIT